MRNGVKAMSRKWKDQQKAAIDCREGKYLISAGAGSGKTAVLTQRVTDLVLIEHVDIGSILVLTFTEKAAMEMKTRIRESILKDPSAIHLAGKIDSANIMTFDAYFLSLVKQFNYVLGISKNISIINQSVDEVLLQRAIRESFDEYYSKGDPLFEEMIFKYAVDDDRRLIDFVFRFYKSIVCLKLDKESYLQTYDEQYTKKDLLDKWLNEYVQTQHDCIRDLIANITPYCEDLQSFEALRASLEQTNKIKDFDAFELALRNTIFPAKPRGLDGEYFDDNYLPYKNILRESCNVDRYLNIVDKFSSDSSYCQVIIDIIKNFDDKLSEYKNKYEVFTFNDIARFAYKLVSIPEICAQIKDSLKYIIVDEYQDTSDLQDAILSKISRGNDFFVGDIKQSIYAYRNANPKLFKKQIHDSPKDHVITMPHNFRSRREVLAGINEIFSHIMSDRFGGVDYKDHQSLEFGQTDYENDGKINQNFDIEVYTYKLDKEPIGEDELTIDIPEETNAATIEARIVADDIITKINDGFLVFEGGAVRKCRFSDFVILVDKRGNYNQFKKVFANSNLPLSCDDSQDLKIQDIVLLIRNILKFISDYIKKDESNYSFLFTSIARSFAFRKNDGDIYYIIKNNLIQQTEIYKKIEVLAAKLGSCSISEFLEKIIDKFSLIENLVFLGDIETNKLTIESLVKTAKDLDKLNSSLDDLVLLFEDLDSLDIKLTSDKDMSFSDAVRLMTIHSSKGLEFPIVYYPGLSYKFNETNYVNKFMVSNAYGLIFPDTSLNEYKNPIFELNKIYARQDNISERIRLLYVALTRCKEKAIIVIPEMPRENKGAGECKSLGQILNIGLEQFKKIDKTNALIHPRLENSFVPQILNIEFEMPEIEVIPQKMVYKHASKDFSLSYSSDALSFGNKMHRYMEMVDFKDINLNFIKDENDKKIIQRALKSPIFSSSSRAISYHELEFYDEEKDLHGAIDLLLVYEDHIDIIDYKLKNISDEEYDQQLNTYGEYIEKKTGKKPHKYLLSLLDGNYRVVE